MILPRMYYDWLLFKVCSDEQKSMYSQTLEYLASVPFVPQIARDDNLDEHVEYMREDFKDEAEANGQTVDIPEGPITLLEVMVNLSIKAEDIMQSFDGVDCGRWFWDMMKNSGLIFYVNYRFKDSGVKVRVSRIIHRTYDPNGNGGLFYIPTLDVGKYDMREIELWYQLMWYIDYCEENE
ncbi:MAG: hypothetical protein J6U54_13290 [Clostridiales bacterium]|nr:hypothetical protein [Clostridiales bacterium]